MLLCFALAAELQTFKRFHVNCFRLHCLVVYRALAILLALVAGRSVSAPVLSDATKEEYRHWALVREGDPLTGRALFQNEERLACARCHAVDGKGGKAGPDLFAVGDKFGRREIIDSILAPSATIAVGYSTTTVETKNGERFQGIVKEVTDLAIELVGGDGRTVRISYPEIEKQWVSEISLMPEELHSGLRKEEFVDLIEYLVTLKQPDNADVLHHGMPTIIPTNATQVKVHPFFTEALKFKNPVWFGQVPGVSNAFLVLEHMAGNIWLLEKSAGGDRKNLFLDLGTNVSAGGTRGVLGLAFHPRFSENRKYYLALHVLENGQTCTLTVEREATADFKHDSGHPPREVLRIKAATNVHYGGCLVFGPDGYLYIGMGDTGPQEDPQGNGQNPRLLRGKLMRIDVDHPTADQAYGIPGDNPFSRRDDIRPEIWALGFREPWRFSFDPVTHDLWVGDVGQDRYEEVDIVRPGENYGWNVYEGFARFSNRYQRDKTKYTPPIFAYARKYGPSVTGGFVYRGDSRSSFYGVYIFGDYESKRIWGLTQKNRRLEKIRQIGVSPQRIVSLGQGARGEIYVVGYEGMIYEIDFREAIFDE